MTENIKHSVSGTFELIHLNGMELLHNLQHCSQTLMCTIHIHTCFSCDIHELLHVCIFLHCLSASEGSPSHRDMSKLLLGEEKSGAGMAEAL